MAVAFDAKSTTVKDATGTSTTITDLTVGSGSNRALVLLFWVDDNTTVPAGLTATRDTGETFTLITGTSTALNGGISAASCLMGLLNPTAGNHTITISWTGSHTVHVAAVSFTGVDQTSIAVAFPHGNSVSNSASTASPISITITSATGNLVLAIYAQNQTADLTVSGTELFRNGGAGPNIGVSASYDNGAASVTMQDTYSGTAPQLASGTDILAAGTAAAFLAKNALIQQAVKRASYI